MAVAQHKDHADLAPARSESRYGSNQRSNAIALAHPIGGVDPDHASHTRIDFSVEFPPAIGIRAAISHLTAPIDEYWQHAKPFVSCDRDGRVSIRFLSGYNARDLSSWSRNLAIGYFIRLLDSPERERLSQCVTCARYFVRERMPKQHAPIKRGSYCKFHRYQRKARSVEAIRAERKGRMLVLAARMAAEYQLKKPREDRSEWIANKMNREIRRSPKLYQWDRTITRKWVTQNEAGIEQRQARDRPGG